MSRLYRNGRLRFFVRSLKELKVGQMYVHDIDLDIHDPRFLLKLPKSLTRGRAGLDLLIFIHSALSTAKRCSTDLVHAHYAFPGGLVAETIKKKLGLPAVLTVHGNDVLVKPSVGYGIRLDPRYDRTVRKVLRGVDRIIVASRFLFETVIELGCPFHRISVIPHGVNLSMFNPLLDGSEVREKMGLCNRPVVLVPKQLYPVYGLHCIINAMPYIKDMVPDVALILTGDGPLKPELQRLVTSLKIKENVFIVGAVPHSSMPKFYAASDVTVLPSLVEGFGISAVEAMAMGKPVVGSRVGGLKEIIDEGVTGLLVEPNNQEDLADKICYLLQNARAACEMGMKGREVAEKRYDVRTRINRIVSLYEELLYK